MSITEQKQAAKGKAFNALLRIYHPKSNWKGDELDREMSYSQQKDQIFNEYFKELEKINKAKSKKNEQK